MHRFFIGTVEEKLDSMLLFVGQELLKQRQAVSESTKVNSFI